MLRTEQKFSWGWLPKRRVKSGIWGQTGCSSLLTGILLESGLSPHRGPGSVGREMREVYDGKSTCQHSSPSHSLA
jgi:hypothetical protein